MKHMYVNSNQKIFLSVSSSDTSVYLIPARSARSGVLQSLRLGELLGSPNNNDMKERSVFFWWGESKGSFFLLTFYGVKVKNTPVGSPCAVVFISDVEALKICKEKINKFQVPFHKNSHDHWIINYYINSSLDDEKERFLRVKLHSVHADAASYSTGLAWCCFDSLNETSTGILLRDLWGSDMRRSTKRLRPEEVFESIEEKLCCRSTRFCQMKQTYFFHLLSFVLLVKRFCQVAEVLVEDNETYLANTRFIRMDDKSFGWIFSSIFSQGLGMFSEEQDFEMFSPGCGKVVVDDKGSQLLFQAA